MLNFSTWKTFQSEKQHRGKVEVWTAAKAAAANVYYHFKTNRVLTWLFGTLHIRSFSHSFRHHFESENVREWVQKSTVPEKIKPIKANIGFALPPQKWHCRLSPSHLLLLLCSEVKRTPLMCLVSCRVVLCVIFCRRSFFLFKYISAFIFCYVIWNVGELRVEIHFPFTLCDDHPIKSDACIKPKFIFEDKKREKTRLLFSFNGWFCCGTNSSVSTHTE